MKKKLIFGGALIVLVVSLGLAAYLFWFNKEDDSNDTKKTIVDEPVSLQKVCSDDLLRRANTALNNNNTADLKTVYDEILTLENYENDQNCVYLLSWYNYVIANYDQASEYQARLSKLMIQATGYSQIFNPAPQRPEALADTIAGSKTNSEANQQFEEEDARLAPDN